MTTEEKPEGQALWPTKFKDQNHVTLANTWHYAPSTVLKALVHI